MVRIRFTDSVIQQQSHVRQSEVTSMSSTTQAVIVIATGVLLAAISAPITRFCPPGPCSTGPDPAGFTHRYYEVKPIAGAWLETISGKRWTIRYDSGTQRDPFPVAP
jgi:hypothetical protein